MFVDGQGSVGWSMKQKGREKIGTQNGSLVHSFPFLQKQQQGSFHTLGGLDFGGEGLKAWTLFGPVCH